MAIEYYPKKLYKNAQNFYEPFDVNEFSKSLEKNIMGPQQKVEAIEAIKSPVQKMGVPKIGELTPMDNTLKLENPNSKGAFADNIGDIIGFAGDTYNMLSNVSSSKKESNMNTLQLTGKGASIGMSVGGPIGAGIGAVIGGGIGLIDKAKDTKIRNKATFNKNESEFVDYGLETDMLYKINKGEKISQSLLDQRKQQQKLVELKF